MLETKSRSGNLNLRDQEIAKNVSTILVAMNQFIATQMAVVCLAATANDMKKKQELEREQARINDMQAKMQESGIDPLAINNERAALAF